MEIDKELVEINKQYHNLLQMAISNDITDYQCKLIEEQLELFEQMINEYFSTYSYNIERLMKENSITEKKKRVIDDIKLYEIKDLDDFKRHLDSWIVDDPASYHGCASFSRSYTYCKNHLDEFEKYFFKGCKKKNKKKK